MQKFQFLFFSFFLIASTNSAISYAFDFGTPLNDAPISYPGANNYKYTGWSVSAGDVDGDGINDLLIGGSPVYLIFGKNVGKKTGTTIEDFADASFIGEDPGDDFGDAVCMTGDVNNDGFDDILIGAKRYDSTRELAQDQCSGKTYLILGKASGWSMNTSITDPAPDVGADATFTGEYPQDWSGYAVAFAGDINNDGFDDFLIGAYMSDGDPDNPVTNVGTTYLFLGKADGWDDDFNVNISDAKIYGEAMYSGSGRKVAPAGNVNNDDYDDFIISAPGDEVYLIFGQDTEWSGEKGLDEIADASFIGESSGDFAGWGVSAAGDVNNDGFDDILIGAEDNDTAATNAGKAYLIFGKDSGWAPNTSLSTADASFYGELTEDNLGKAVSAAGDVNNDGFDDFLIGATSANQWTGKAYLVLGQETDWSTNTSIATAHASFLGEATYDYAGFTMATAGDINADGSADFMISAAYFGSYYTGKVYFYYGEGPVTGDLTADGIVDITDAVTGLKIISKTDQSTIFEYGNDVNGDNVLGMEEVIYDLQKTAGLK